MHKFMRGEPIRLSNYKLAFPHNVVVKASFTKVTVRHLRTGEVKTFPYDRMLHVVEKRNEWIRS